MEDATCTRSVAFELRADPQGDGLTLEGYAAVFNTPTTIEGMPLTVFHLFVPDRAPWAADLKSLFYRSVTGLFADKRIACLREIKTREIQSHIDATPVRPMQ